MPDPSTGFRSWPRRARWATGLVGLLVLLLVAASVTAVVVVRHSFPQVDGQARVPGLGQDVQVVRDDHGIPQVYAATSHDLFYAQGYVEAQDRFFEMDFRRHVTAGRLSEMFGRATLQDDMYVRTMGWRRVAQRELALLDPETVAYLEAFSDGVNAYLHSHSTSELSLEYTVLDVGGLNYTPEDWTPVDSLAWLKAMAWDLKGNLDAEVQRSLLSVDYSHAEIDQLYPAYPYHAHRPIVQGGGVVDGVFEQDATHSGSRKPSRAPLSPAMVRALRHLDTDLRTMPHLLGQGHGLGSNSWVVSGDHTRSGKPLLANDPHLGVSMPGVWYQIGLHCRTVSAQCPFDVSGFTFSGLPGVVIGHNAHIAWGFTNLGPDVTDLYLEKLTGTTYRYDGKDRPLKIRHEKIAIKGEDKPYSLTVRSTDHGPLLSDVSSELSTVGANASVGRAAPPRDHGYAVALRWTALTPANTADAIFELDRASGWDDFRAAASDFAVPAQNLVYADRQGNIGYQAPGRIPIRRSGNDGDYPSEGWDPANDWTGDYVPFAALPSVLNPDDGYLVTANQAVTNLKYPYHLGDDWDYGYRSQLINDRLGSEIAHGPVDVGDMTRLQLDTHNELAPVLVPYLQKILMPTSYYAAGQRLLDGWDGDQSGDSSAAAYFNAVYRDVLALTFHDQLRESLWPDDSSRWFAVLANLLQHPNSKWWDNVDTETAVETRDDILTQAMEDARNDLTRLQARRASDWTWGHQHQLRLVNQSLGTSGIGLVERLFNRGGWEVGGGMSTVDATAWDPAEDFTVTAAPSMRMVVSLADWDASRWINLTGVSGHAFDAHYTDQTDLWADGRTLPWAFGSRAVEQAGEHELTLVPTAAQ